MDTTTVEAEPEFGLVFFSGAGLDSWIWEPLLSHLALPACLVDLPGRGQLSSVSTARLSLDDYMSLVQPQLEQFTPRKQVFVCHSLGAVLGLSLAERYRDRVHGIIHVASVIPRSGTSYCGSLPFPANLVLPLVMKLFGTKPPESVIRTNLCEDLPESLADRVVSGFCPESRELYRQNVVYPSEIKNRGYVVTRRDKTLVQRLQRRLAQRAGISAIEELDAGHLVMLQSPERLAEVITTMIRVHFH